MRKNVRLGPSTEEVVSSWCVEFSSFPKFFPRNWSKRVTPAELLRQGFERVDQETFRKSFNDVLDLLVEISDQDWKTYIWILNQKGLRVMLREMKTLRSDATVLAGEIHRIFWELRRPKADADSLRAEWLRIEGEAHAMRDRFLSKYDSFLSVFRSTKGDFPYVQSQNFMFDACKTRKQLDLYVEFVRLYIDMFVGLTEGRTRDWEISADALKLGIVYYYLILFTIREMRMLYGRGAGLTELGQRFHMFDGKVIELLTEDQVGKKGWRMKASHVALYLAGRVCGTTPKNLRKLLTRERLYAKRVRTQIEAMTDPELGLLLSPEAEIPLSPFWRLTIERVPKRRWIRQFRWMLLHL